MQSVGHAHCVIGSHTRLWITDDSDEFGVAVKAVSESVCHTKCGDILLVPLMLPLQT